MAAQRVFVDVDVQFDFCEPAGSLYVKGSPNDRFRALTRFAREHSIPIVGSVDSHAWDAWEFGSNARVGPKGEDPRFPDHCVKGTPGWLKVQGTLPTRFRFIPDAPGFAFESVVHELSLGATQGVYFEKEVYSLFANRVAEGFVQAFVAAIVRPVEFVVYGVATDYCVRAAALGLAERGYSATVLTDAMAGITPEGTEAALLEMTRAGVKLDTAASVIGRFL